jgi:hypothetical protein
MVGPWRIVEPLGSGTFGHSFKAELAGEFFTLMLAVRPAIGLPQETLEEEEEEEVSREQALEELFTAIQALGERARAAEEKAARYQKLGRRLVLAAGSLPLILALVAVWRVWLSPASLVEPGTGSSPAVAQQGVSSGLSEAAVTEPVLITPEPLLIYEGVAAELPSGPLPGQRLPPCKRPQLEISGGCWILVGNEAPPCVGAAYEWRKRCYVPWRDPPRPGTSGAKEPPE